VDAGRLREAPVTDAEPLLRVVADPELDRTPVAVAVLFFAASRESSAEPVDDECKEALTAGSGKTEQKSEDKDRLRSSEVGVREKERNGNPAS
jgi:hypothetical protein